MGKIIDRGGQKFNHWTFVFFKEINRHGEAVWMCRCDCGQEVLQVAGNVVSGGSKQCKKCATKTRDYSSHLGDSIWNLIVRRAKKKGWELSITKQEAEAIYEQQQGKCALSGLSISHPKNGTEYLQRKWTASLDRKDSKKGYIPGNVKWVHKTVNYMKNTLTDDVFIEFCKQIASHNEKTN